MRIKLPKFLGNRTVTAHFVYHQSFIEWTSFSINRLLRVYKTVECPLPIWDACSRGQFEEAKSLILTGQASLNYKFHKCTIPQIAFDLMSRTWGPERWH